MKKLLCSIVLVLFSITALVAEERVIDQSMLPKNAQSFIATHYPEDKISISTMERGILDKDYKVILTSGVKIEFDDNGQWTEVEATKHSEVPAQIIPSNIAQQIKNRFPSNKVVKIERVKKFIEVELNNDIELKFNNKGILVEFDS